MVGSLTWQKKKEFLVLMKAQNTIEFKNNRAVINSVIHAAATICLELEEIL